MKIPVCLLLSLVMSCSLDDVRYETPPDAALDPSRYVVDEAFLLKPKPSSDPFCLATRCCTSDDQNNGGTGWCTWHHNVGQPICRINCNSESLCDNCVEDVFWNEWGVLVTHTECRCSDSEF